MIQFSTVNFSPEDVAILRHKLQQSREVFDFSEDVKFASTIAAYGLLREIGTVNDEISRFLFNPETKTQIPREDLKGDIFYWNSLIGCRISSKSSQRLEIRARGVRELLHPDFSFDSNGDIEALVIFPEIVARICESRGVHLAIVKSWAMNAIFGGFDPSKEYYQTNFWELCNNDTTLFARLVANKRLAFLGTHDFMAHISGLSEDAWPNLTAKAEEVDQVVQEYLSGISKPTIPALVLPYTSGVILDDLAQPPSYGSLSHLIVLDEVLEAMRRKSVPPQLISYLKEFPGSFQQVIELSRNKELAEVRKLAPDMALSLTNEIRENMLLVA